MENKTVVSEENFERLVHSKFQYVINEIGMQALNSIYAEVKSEKNKIPHAQVLGNNIRSSSNNLQGTVYLLPAIYRNVSVEKKNNMVKIIMEAIKINETAKLRANQERIASRNK